MFIVDITKCIKGSTLNIHGYFPQVISLVTSEAEPLLDLQQNFKSFQMFSCRNSIYNLFTKILETTLRVSTTLP